MSVKNFFTDKKKIEHLQQRTWYVAQWRSAEVSRYYTGLGIKQNQGHDFKTTFVSVSPLKMLFSSPHTAFIVQVERRGYEKVCHPLCTPFYKENKCFSSNKTSEVLCSQNHSKQTISATTETWKWIEKSMEVMNNHRKRRPKRNCNKNRKLDR